MTRCPVCRARLSDVLNVCLRCDCELSQLLRIEEQANRYLCRAVNFLRWEDLDAAIQAAVKSSQLKQSRLALAIIRYATYCKSIAHAYHEYS